MATKRKASEQASTSPWNKRARATSRVSEPSSEDDMPRKRGTSRARARRRAMVPSPSPPPPPPPPSPSPQPSAPVAEKLTIPGLIAEYEVEEEDDPVATAESASEKTTILDEGPSEDEDDDDPLLTRIRAGMAYTRTQYALGLPVMQTTHFAIVLPTAEHTPSPSQTTALALLSAAYKIGHAALISNSPYTRVYELGVPVPYLVAEGAGVNLLHSPHWWVGKSAAEIEAGPHAEEKDIRRAAAHLKGQATKRKKAEKNGKTKREKEIDYKLAEGLRRQEAGLKMWDSDGESSEGSGSESGSGSSSDSGNSSRKASESGSEGSDNRLSVIPEESEEESDSPKSNGVKGAGSRSDSGSGSHHWSSDSEDSSGNEIEGSKNRLSAIAEQNEEEEEDEADSPSTKGGKKAVVQEPSEDSDSDAPLVPKVPRRSLRAAKKVRQPTAATEASIESDSDAPLLPRKVRRSPRAREAAVRRAMAATEAATNSEDDAPVRPGAVRRNLRARKVIRSSQPAGDSDSDAPLVAKGRSQRRS